MGNHCFHICSEQGSYDSPIFKNVIKYLNLLLLTNRKIMENRLPNLQRLSLMFVGLFACFNISIAQVDISFEYTGPDSISVGSDCTAELDWGAPGTVGVTCNTPGCTITSFTLHSISGGYMIGSDVQAGVVVDITYRATYNNNGSNGSLLFTFQIVFYDETPPVFDPLSLPSSGTFDCLADVPAVANPTATDNCPPPGGTSVGVTVVYNGQTSPPTTCNGGSFTRTWTATDLYGNSAVYTQSLTVQGDTDAPVITTSPVGATELCESADYVSWLDTQRTNFNATDSGCGLASLTDNAPANYDADCSSITVVFTATDNCNNSVSVSVTYAIVDNEDPVIAPPAVTNITIQCDGLPTDPMDQILNWQNSFMVSDNCTALMDITWSNNFTSLTGGCGGNTGSAMVVYTATDQCGNSAQVTINFTVEDSNDPDIISGALDTTVICDGAGNTAELADWLNNRGYANAVDYCTEDSDIILTLRMNGNVQTVAMVQDSIDNQLATGCGASVTVEFAFEDLCGNTSTSNAEFTIEDNTGPTITIPAAMAVVECDNPSISFATWISTRGGAMATDGCTDIDNSSTSSDWTSTILSDVPGTCPNETTRTVRFTVTDQCGLTASTTAAYAVVDNISPTISPTATNLTEECGGGNDQMALNTWINSFGGAAANDACSNITWDNIAYTTSAGMVDNNVAIGDLPSYPQVVANNCEWSVQVIFAVEDECGNVSTTMATFSITDNTNPVMAGINAANDTLTLSCDAPIPGFPNITATDNCDASVAITVDSTDIELTCQYNFLRTRVWTGTDDCGNTATIVQVIIVDDNTDPFLTGLGSDVTVSCDAVPPIPVLGTDYTANDNCDININDGVTFDEVSTRGANPNNCNFYNYTLTRTWTVTDVCGNIQVYTRVITVQDTVDPTFTQPGNVTVDCHVSLLPPNTGDPTNVSDNCDGDPDVTWSDVIINPPGACVNEYVIQRTWMVTDACGNVSIPQMQLITVQDTLAPSFTTPAENVNLECTSETVAENSFLNWVANNGNAVANDLCTAQGDLQWFAAVPGSYDINDPGTWPGTAPGALSTSVCPSPVPGVYRSETVDFVVIDECENASVTTGTFNVTDTEDPSFDYCPDDDVANTEPGECFAVYTLPTPIISDGCNDVQTYNFNRTRPIASANPGNDVAIVNTVMIDFNGLPTAPVLATGTVSLTLNFTMLDAEEPSEYFNIFGDDGSVLGVSDNTATQCGDVTTVLNIPAATYNAWASDGQVNIMLVPNIPSGQPGIFAINDICPDGAGTGGGSSVTASLAFMANNPNGLVFQYGINSEPLVTVDPIAATVVNLLAGTNVITYYATDCAGNTGTCDFTVVVEDNENPVITCPANVDYFLTPDDGCGDIEIELGIPSAVTDNCSFDINTQTQPGNVNNALLTFTYNPNYLEYVADDKDFTFVGVAANAVGTVATFTVTITGDADNAEEYFSIFDEDGNLLGTTEAGQSHVTVTPQACPVSGVTVAVIEVPVSTFNMWAADGIIGVTAVSNNTFAAPPSGGPDDGINPSCTTFPNGTPDGTSDNVSTIFIELEYQSTSLFFATTGATNTPLTEMLPPAISPTITFDIGQTDVTYMVTDNSGNEASCQFVVTVLDTIPPVALCEPPTFIFVSPSGNDDYDIEFYEIDDHSFDENCDIAGFTISPNNFNCLQEGDLIPVTLTISDESGNVDSCTTVFSIALELPEPTYATGLCGDDNLSLFAEAPYAPGDVVYTFIWRNPAGAVISNLEDPVITGVDASDSGSYTVEITGLTGCVATGVVNVIINDEPNVPELFVNENTVCNNEDIVLTTQNINGTNVVYNWYSGFAPNGTLLATTTTPVYTIPAPLAVGTTTYYVIVTLTGCVSDPSDFQTVTVSASPVATTNAAVINICAGDDIVLGTTSTGPGYTYEWTGPNGYLQSSSTPAVVTNANLNNAGVYNLIITANGCESNVASTVVNVTPTPAQPIVSTTGIACSGDDITLISNNTTANSYTWIAPNFTEIITASNTLTLTNVTAAQSGLWRLFVTTNGCESPTSDPVSVFVVPTITVVASNNSPICQGENVQLLVNSIPGATYFWSGPGGFASASQNPITTAVAGNYSVTVTSSTGCSNVATTAVSVSAAPTITALSNTGAPCVTGANDIFLVPTVFPPDPGGLNAYEYYWIGPNGFVSTAVSPLLPNGTSIDNGSYVLQVTNAAGCVSNSVTTVVNVSDAPQTPTLVAPSGLCTGGTLTLLATPGEVGSSVTYTWMTPLGTVTTGIPSLTIPNVTIASSGNYNVLVTVDGCTSLSSNMATVVVGAVPATPVIATNSPVCEGETLTFLTDFIPGAEYIWTGPGNFDSDLYNPFRPNADADFEGTYQVQVIIGGCPSVFSAPVNVEVNATPSTAIAVNNGPICIDDSGITLILSVTSGTAVPGASYTWYNAQTGNVVAGPTSSLNASIVDFSGFSDGLYDFYVVTNLNGCTSVNSVPTTVVMNTIPPNEAFAGPDVSICDGQAVTLSAAEPTIGSGNWIQLTGPAIVIVNPNSPTTPLSGLAAGNSYTFLWTLSNGACGAYDSDDVVITVNSNAQIAIAGTDQSLCNQTSTTLSATAASVGASGMWTQTPAQAALGVTIINPSNPNTAVTGMEPGNNYSFVWSLSNNGCGQFAADEVIIEIEESNVVANAGIDIADCGNGEVELEALATTSGTGTWSSPNSDVDFEDANNRRTTVSGLETGVYTFVWTLDNGPCGITVDSVEVEYEAAPIAVDDILSVTFGGQNMIDVTINDNISGDFTISLLSNATKGSVTNPSGSEFIYIATAVFAGVDSFSYLLCSEICPSECTEATVRVIVGENAECTVPTIFTPNEDGINDEFVVPCLATDKFPTNVVSIFNQWGDQVFRGAPYANNWKGTYDGQDLPVGTYFYVIEFGNGESVQSGFLVLER
jgi:gliding motility-associated-like protein